MWTGLSAVTANAKLSIGIIQIQRWLTARLFSHVPQSGSALLLAPTDVGMAFSMATSTFMMEVAQELPNLTQPELMDIRLKTLRLGSTMQNVCQ